jgi:hypothetical protein
MPHIVKEALQDFRRSVEITRDVRFQANLRLVRRQRASAYIVSLFSLFVIALSLIPNVLSLQTYQSQSLLGCTIVLSVFVIFTSLIDGAQNFYHQGELLHQCARRIAFINHMLKNIDTDADETAAMTALGQLQKDYQVALDECPINHENVDYYGEVVRKPHLFPDYYPWNIKGFHKVGYRVRVFIMEYSWVFWHVIAVVSILCFVYFYVVRGSSPVSPR